MKQFNTAGQRIPALMLKSLGIALRPSGISASIAWVIYCQYVAMMVVARRKVGIPASLMTHSHYLTQCVLAIAGWRGLGLHETRKIQESRGTRNSPNMKIARTLIWWPRAADRLFGGLARIGGEGFRRELLLRGVRPPVASDTGKILGRRVAAISGRCV